MDVYVVNTKRGLLLFEDGEDAFRAAQAEPSRWVSRYYVIDRALAEHYYSTNPEYAPCL